METEKKLVEFICHTTFEDIPREALTTVGNILRAVLGTTIADSTCEGCGSLAEYYRELGGKEEATVFVHGGKLPAHNAVLLNSVMARALDFDDAMAPGIHIGASAVPTAFGAAELAGRCSGRDFLTALAVGVETAAPRECIRVCPESNPCRAEGSENATKAKQNSPLI